MSMTVFQHYMPSNRLLAATRTRRGVKWGVSAMLVGVPYLAIANVFNYHD